MIHNIAICRIAVRSFMSLFFAASLSLLLSASPTLANNGGGFSQNNAGGFTGPGTSFVTVEQAKAMRDDSYIALKGSIVQQIGNEKYLFKDNTGTIHVEIDKKIWQGQNVGPNDVVEIYGELDKDWTAIEIDVDRLIKK